MSDRIGSAMISGGSSRISGEAQIFFASLLAGSGWLFSVQALKELPPMFFIGSRFALARLVLLLIFGSPRPRQMRDAWKGLVFSSVAMTAAMALWITGLKHTDHLGVAAFITAMGNLIVPVVGRAVFGWPLASRSLISFAIAVCGLALLFLGNGAGFQSSDVMFLVSALLWAVSLVFVRQECGEMNAAHVSGAQLLCTGVLVLAALFVWEALPTQVPSMATFGWFLASLGLSTCLRFVLQFRGLSRAEPARAALLMIFEPVWALAFPFVFVGTAMTAMQSAGCAVIFAAVASEALKPRAASQQMRRKAL